MTLTLKDMLVRLLAVFLLIAINAFFVTAEFSMVSVRRSRISQLVEAGDAPARSVQKLQRRIDLLLSTTQFGITLSSLALGWIAEGTVAVALRSWLSYLPVAPQIQATLSHSVAIPLLTFFAIAYLQIVLGELYPKSVALLYPEQLARLLAPPSLAIARFFRPFVWALNQSTRWLLKLGGMTFTGEPYTRVTPEELQLIIATSTESTGLEAEERQLLNNVFEFGDVAAEEVMIPRTSIVALPRTATFQTLLDETAVSGHSRYPVTGESLDDIVGIVDFKDLAKPLAEGILSADTPLEPWVRPARFISEQILLSELLPLMQRAHTEMVIIVDEFGGTAGLVTIQDLVAEIIGESAEPTQTEEIKLQYLDEQTFLVQAQLDIEEVNELLNLNLPLTEEYQTIAGFMIDQLQKIPAEGEVLNYHNLELTVAATEGPRLDKIQIRLIETEIDAELLTDLMDQSDADEGLSDSAETVQASDPPIDNLSELDLKEDGEIERWGDEDMEREGEGESN
jgi:CBS domain containing-hemolysin-like protein